MIDNSNKLIKRYKQWDTRDFYMENPPLTVEIKKTTRSKTTNLNLLYEIKLHKFTWSLYPKDFLSNTYNMIHVRNTIIVDCSSEYTSTLLKGWRSLTQDSNIKSLNKRSGMVCHVRFSLWETLFKEYVIS